MLNVQSSYGQSLPVGVPGKKVDNTEYQSISRPPVQPLEFGVFVVETATGAVDLPSTSTDKVTGLAMHYNKMPSSFNGLIRYEMTDPVNVATIGRFYVTTETAVIDITATPFVRYLDGGTATTPKGILRGTAGTSEAFSAPFLKYRSLAPAGGVVEVEFSLP